MAGHGPARHVEPRQKPPGWRAWIHLLADASLDVENYRRSSFAHVDAYGADAFMAHYHPCPGCPNDCVKVLRVDAMDDLDPRAGGMHQEVTGALYASAPTRLLSVRTMGDLLASITGWETSSAEVMRWGERRMHIMRMYNLREGLTAADDRLPDRFFEEAIESGPKAGVKLDREAFTEAIETYYQMMGWDEAGVPRPATLYDHHLEWTLPDGAGTNGRAQ